MTVALRELEREREREKLSAAYTPRNPPSGQEDRKSILIKLLQILFFIFYGVGLV